MSALNETGTAVHRPHLAALRAWAAEGCKGKRNHTCSIHCAPSFTRPASGLFQPPGLLQCSSIMEPEHPRIRELVNESGTARLTYTGGIQDDISSTHTDSSAPVSPLRESTSFSFPSLARDGSTLQQSDQPSPHHHPTPPAALSSKGAAARSMATDMSTSVNSLDDGNYDMVDDASDVSLDHPETASLPSTADHSDDDGMDTPDDTGSIIDVGEELDAADRTLTLGGSHETLPGVQDDAAGEAYSPEHDEVMDSFLRDDLETPRQSTMYRFIEKTPESHDRKQESPPSSGTKITGKASSNWGWFEQTCMKQTQYGPQPKSWFLFAITTLLIAPFSWHTLNIHPTDHAVDAVARREALSMSLGGLTGSDAIAKVVNITHLIPSPGSEDLTFAEFTPRTAVLGPNRLLLSLPRTITTGRYQLPVDSKLTKADHELDFNLTNIIDGVWAFAIDAAEAYGPVHFTMKLTTGRLRPHEHRPLSFTQDFGRRSLQHATTDLSKALSKEVIVARERANSLKDLIGLELLAGVAATRNVATEIAVYVARDVQVFANTTASFVSKTSKARRDIFDQITRDLAGNVEVALSTLSNNSLRLSSAVTSAALMTRDSAELTLRHSKQFLRDGLILSRQRALKLKARLTGQPQFANSTSATKELSLRFQNLFNSTEQTRRAGSLPDIARCATAPDYAACRREQRRRAASLQPAKVKEVGDKGVKASHSISLSFVFDTSATSTVDRDSLLKNFNQQIEEQMDRAGKQKEVARKEIVGKEKGRKEKGKRKRQMR